MGGVFFISSKSNLKEYMKANVPNLYQIMRDEIIYPIFKQKVLWSTLGEDTPLIKLVLSRKDVAHFSEIYRRWETEVRCHAHPELKCSGSRGYYSENNQWKKANLFYRGKKYKIKIKAHGRAPTSHRAGKYISFGIKLRGNHQINKDRKSTRLNSSHW